MARADYDPGEPFDAANETAAVLSLAALRQPRFGELVAAWRAAVERPIASVARDAGVAAATWCDAEAGRDVKLSTAVRMIAWAMRSGLV